MGDVIKIGANYAPLSQITTKIGSGATPRGGKESYKTEGISLIRSLNVHDFVFKFMNLARIDENQAAKLRNVTVSSKDILLNITGASVCRCCMVPSTVLPARVNQHVAIIRINAEVADPHYVLYTLNSKSFKDGLLNISMTGATREALTKSDIERFKIPIPPLPTQRKIAAILTSYDDLIEINKHRIALLEYMAEELYREWFVRMRFPGHQNTEFVKGIPSNWVIREMESLVSDIIDYRGLTPTKLGGHWAEDGIIALSALNVKSGELIRLNDSKRVSEQLYERWMRKELQSHDILLTSEAPLGQAYFLVEQHRYVLSQRLFAIRAKPSEVSPAYLYQYLRYPIGQGQLESRATGATVGGIRQTLLKKVEVIVPTDDLMKAHEKQVLPILEEIHVLWKQNATLIESRDLFLPRLISGKLSVEGFDIQLPPSMHEESAEPEAAHA